jgi:hypothetical protein
MRTTKQEFDVDVAVRRLLPPSPQRHEVFSRSQVAALVKYVDDRQPFFYNGHTLALRQRHLAVGQYRVWFEVQ